MVRQLLISALHIRIGRVCLRIAVVLFLALSPPRRSRGEERLDDLLDLKALRSSGDDWQVVQQEITGSGGRVVLDQDKWLMYFLHWRPRTPAGRDLTLDYVRDHMRSFWGEAIQFELTGEEQNLEICGHPAYLVGGTFGQGAIHSQFIVWNCSQTDRQFTADCNVNVRRGTDPRLLTLQTRITRTVSCHQNGKPAFFNELPQRYESAKWNVSFSIPRNWRASDFPDNEWFPSGISSQSGSLWTLLTDSKKHLELTWSTPAAKPSPDLLRAYLAKLPIDSLAGRDSVGFVGVAIDSIREQGAIVAGYGTYVYKNVAGQSSRLSDYAFRALLWKHRDRVYFLIASLALVKEFWGRPVDLNPSAETIEHYLTEEILPTVKVFKE